MSVTFRNEETVLKFFEALKSIGFTDNGAWGMLANNYVESGWVLNNLQNTGNKKLNMTDAEYTKAVDDGTYANFATDRIGYGWAQWTTSRKAKLLEIAKAKGKSVGDAEVQIETMIWEIKNKYKKNILDYCSDPNRTLANCTRQIMVYYEGPANQSESNKQKRVNIAEEIVEHFTKKEEKLKHFTQRTVKPKIGDKYIAYYNTLSNGGLSQCVKGNEPDAEANVLRNCVGYANGRFNEIISEVTDTFGMRYQLTTDAERFIEQAKSKGLEVSQYPSKGALIVWQKGETLAHGDGAGHVEVVEDVLDYNKIFDSRSGWTSPVFGTITRTNANGNWGKTSPYKFRGFIRNPAVNRNPYPIPNTTLKKGCKGDTVKWLQTALILLGYGIACDGSFGGKTDNAVKEYQKSRNLEVDGKVGGNTRRSLLHDM